MQNTIGGGRGRYKRGSKRYHHRNTTISPNSKGPSIITGGEIQVPVKQEEVDGIDLKSIDFDIPDFITDLLAFKRPHHHTRHHRRGAHQYVSPYLYPSPSRVHFKIDRLVNSDTTVIKHGDVV